MMRSPSFSLFSSSITTRNSPAAKEASASSIESKANVVRLGASSRSVGRHGWEGLWMPLGAEEVWV